MGHNEKGERAKLTDKYQPAIYVSAEQDELEQLISRLYNNPLITSWRFVHKHAQPTDTEKTSVLELTLKDCRKTQALTRSILKMGDYLRIQVHNCDLKGDRSYFFSHHIFPLAHVEAQTLKTGLTYTLLDSASSLWIETILFSLATLVFISAVFLIATHINTRFGLYEMPAVRLSRGVYVPKASLFWKVGFSPTETALMKKDFKGITRRHELTFIFIENLAEYLPR